MGLNLGERKRRASRLPCVNLGFGDNRLGMSESRDVSLTIFITSMSGSESLTSFTDCIFHCSRPSSLKLAFDAAKGMEDLAALGVREMKRAAAAETERDEYSSVEGQ